ncbi:hypothetical protein Pcinc_012337 [Petrolisthes cinctipes]|uniref:Integrase zinc-binding domain-containing protein n=1 Tax=Petrolisthes cinctipes TaxID=88211 RepID=A0AAE1KVF8_PETCI|nr:hypothetical protein Pcinc_012337 [Petrolisthes cinctipes]
MLKKYEKWCSNHDRIGEVTVSRWVCTCKMVSSREMHHFADASSSEYATCPYLRILYEDGDIDVTFMLGKCIVVPFKPVLSIPHLELIAAVLSVQLATKLRKELPQRYIEYFWTDSTVVLRYIKNTAARFKIFVANRVQRIRDRSSPEEWFHIDSAENPSDDGSVWSARWLKGPDFLRIPDLITEHINPVVAPDDVEVKCLSSFGDEPQVAVQVNTFRNWFSTLKLWAWILRFTDNCRGIKRKGNLRVEELEKAKINLIRMVQRLHFVKELGALSSQNAVCRGSPLFKLDVFLDEDGLIRVGGRIRQSSLSDDVKHPVVFPSNHGFSRLIIQHFHQKTHHQRRGITCSAVYSHGFWILSLHRLVKKLIHSCAICSRLRGRPVEQKMADLPEDRLSPCSPFWFSGCDLFGRYVKSGRRECCCDVHLLVGARNDLMKMGCDMVFIPPSSSHRGGVWERMIGVARRIIEGILVEHGSRLVDEGLMTAV